MLKVSSNIKLNMPALESLEDAALLALADTADALLTEIKNAEVMPFDTGNLQNENTFIDGSELKNGVMSIVSSTPYARRLYFHPEFNFSRVENIAAGAHWLDPWLYTTRRNFCSEAFAKFFKRRSGL